MRKHRKNCSCTLCLPLLPEGEPPKLGFDPGMDLGIAGYFPLGPLPGGRWRDMIEDTRLHADFPLMPGHAKPPSPLGAVVARQLKELTADFEGVGHAELPSPPVTDRYADAYASAIRNCDHPAVRETLYASEWQCERCGKLFTPSTVPKRGFWDLFQ